jgi:CheY-like chemotaxis protein
VVGRDSSDQAGGKLVHVLVVDDTGESRRATVRALRSLGAVAIEANNGKTARRICRVSGTGIDLVLMDVVMPGMDGLEATRLIRQLPADRQVPIVGWSSRADDHARAAALAAGMDDLVVRQVDPAFLRRLLDSWAGEHD